MISETSALQRTLLTLIKPLGKPVSLIPGEIIEAKVLDILQSGGVTLQIKGSALAGKTEVPLEKGATAFFKVQVSGSGDEVRLQFIKYAGKPQAGLAKKNQPVEEFVKDLSALLLKEGSGKIAEASRGILRLLTAEPASTPNEFALQAGNILRDGIESSGLLNAFLPYDWKELKDGSLQFRKSRRGERKLYSCRIDLDLAQHGELSIMVLMMDKEFLAYCKISDDEFREVLSSSISELKDSFAGMGMKLRISFLDKETPFEEAERKATEEGIVDIRI